MTDEANIGLVPAFIRGRESDEALNGELEAGWI
jgi:hypothetical protein